MYIHYFFRLFSRSRISDLLYTFSVSISLKVENYKGVVTCIQYFFKVPGLHMDLKYKLFLLHSAKENNIRTLSPGIQNDDEAIMKLIFTTFVDIIVKI